MRAAHIFLPALALVTVLTIPSLAIPLSPESFVLLENDALLVMPHRQVATGIVTKADWSPDGRYVLATRYELPYPLDLLGLKAPPVASASLVLWNAATGKAKNLWNGETRGEVRGSFEWLSRGDVALALLDIQRPTPIAERRAGANPYARGALAVSCRREGRSDEVASACG